MNDPDTVYIEVPVEVPIYIEIAIPVPVPGEGGEVWVDSFTQPYEMDGIDIVWAIDQSGSMHQHATSVVNGIEAMMNALPASGWRLGITTTARYWSVQTTEFPLVPGDTVDDAWDAYNNVGNQGQEAGFDSMFDYIENNSYTATWLRPDAGLLTVFVSDEEEQSNYHMNSVSEFTDWYDGLRTNVFLASIVNVPADETLCTSHAAMNVGDDYIEATNHFGGTVVDICSEDWSPGVSAATAEVLPYESWELTHLPLEDTIRVFINTQQDWNWTWDSTTNEVLFSPTPPSGVLVEIGYIINQEP
jgi:hypothetical protein